MKSLNFRVWFYIFLAFVLFFFLLNSLSGWDLFDAIVRSGISALIVDLLFFIFYLFFIKKKDTGKKGNFFDEKDSKK